MHDSDIRAQLQGLFDARVVPATVPAALGCEFCAALGQRAWVARRRVQAEDLIRAQKLDHLEIRLDMLGVSSDLCDVCRGYPEREEGAARRARALFLAAILPACTARVTPHHPARR